jgi:predicted phage terminase large subunit-like protein
LRELQGERQKRLRAKDDLLTYASTIEIPGAPSCIEELGEDKFVPVQARFGAHHLLWLNCLQQVKDSKIKRLMGLMPPGSAKSTYSSVVFPTHYLGSVPKSSIIVASYGSELPKKFGRRARSIVSSPIYRRIFDCTLSEQSQAADEWALTNGSEWMARGILTGITGNRVDGIIWDDLIKGREQADSDIQRNKTWDAYMDDLMTRRKPFTWEVGITTRWHEDDPSGRILPADYSGESGWLKGQDGNDWYVLCLPAEADRADDPLGRKIGEILWPEWFTPEHFAPFKRNARTWSALFQQKPAPEEGTFFQKEWLRPYGPLQKIKMPPRETMSIYGASDYAVSEDKNDYTCHIVVGIDPTGRMFLLDLWREQADPKKWINSFCDLVERWRPLGWAEEKGQIKLSVGPFLTERLRKRRLYIARADFPAVAQKPIRAQSIRGRMDMDGLYVPVDAPWYPAFEKELLTFPAGRNDDQVDALGLIGQILDKMVMGNQLAGPAEPPKVLSTVPELCTVTLDDMFEANEQRSEFTSTRIH